jgi:exodeoxyribonuclease VII small subunit
MVSSIVNRRGTAMELKVKDFESALKSLEDIVVQLEAGELTLDRSLELFEEGIRVSHFCSSKLDEAERKVEVLIKTADGTMKEAPFSENVEATEP